MSDKPFEEMTLDELVMIAERESLGNIASGVQIRELQNRLDRKNAEYEGLKKRASERMYAMARLLKFMDENRTTHGAGHGQIEMLTWIATRWAQADSMDFKPEIDASDVPF